MDKYAELQKRIEKLEAQQLQLPIDVASMQALNQAFISNKFDSILVDSIFLTTGNSINPSKEGQIVYHENGGTQQLKVFIDGAVKVFTLV